jgi:hypothetical protein
MGVHDPAGDVAGVGGRAERPRTGVTTATQALALSES